MKIALFGGSFNPITKGHSKIARDAVKKLNLDKLIFIPANKNPFKKKEEYVDGQKRIDMIKLVLEDKMEVSDFEIKRKGTSFTIDTVRYFKQKYPNDELFLIIGTDQLYKLNKWRDIDEIASTVKIVIYKRTGAYSKINIKKFNCQLMDNALYKFSSTEFKKGDFSQISKEVGAYIGKNHLYIKDILLGMQNPTRHKHSMATGDAARAYARSAGYDTEKAYFAGIVHDITKNWPEEKHREFLTYLGLNEKDYKFYQLHSLTGSLWLKHIYQLPEEDIIEAVLKHTSLDKELNLLDKIIFAADKTAAGRKFVGVQDDRKLLLENFNEGFKNIVKKTFEFVDEARDLSEEQKDIYRMWF